MTFKVGEHAKISKYKNIFAKISVPNWLEEIKLCHGHMLLVTLTVKSVESQRKKGSNCKKELPKTNQKS